MPTQPSKLPQQSNIDATDASITADDYEVALWINRIQQAQLFHKLALFGRVGARRLFDASEQLSKN